MRTILAQLTVIGMSTMAGCISYNDPGDVQFERMDLTNWPEERELPNMAINMKRPIIKVTFSTQKYLEGMLSNGPVLVHSFACSDQSENDITASPAVYRNHHRLLISGGAPNSDGARYNYYFYIDISNKTRPPSIRDDMEFDLISDPKDICTIVRTGVFESRTYSNLLRIPQDIVKTALSIGFKEKLE